MQPGAGRETYTAALTQLGQLGGTGKTKAAAAKAAAALATVGDELLAVADLLGRQPGLRRALADPGRPAQGRVALLHDLLDGKVGADALGLAATLVAGRYAAPSHLLDAVERLGVQAMLAGAARTGGLAEVEDELFRFGQVVDGSPTLSGALADTTAPLDQRAALVVDLLKDKARPVTVRLVTVALAGFGGRGFSASLHRMVELAAAQRDSEVAYVTVASPLSDQDERRLGDRLAQMYGRDVSIKVTVDPAIVGGLSVRVGSDLYDGTIASRLAQARTALTK